MKKIITLAVLGMLGAVPVSAQTVYDAANIANKDLNGTARFVSMGGAMGALGGDISTIATNPAGIGIYRSKMMQCCHSVFLLMVLKVIIWEVR